eukprot:gene7942-16269_t
MSSVLLLLLASFFSFSFSFRKVQVRKGKVLTHSTLFVAIDKEYKWAERDETWMKDANTIEYVVGEGVSFESLGAIGLNISAEISSRNIIPHHLITGNDIFCNRELNMKNIDCIGFDMDWTLAQYNVEFDLLAYNGAKEKLVNLMGYPKEVLQLEYLPNMCRRGCVIDKKRGNILKLDRHKYVTDAEHGMTELSREQRKSLYRQTFQELQHFGGSNFVCMDTPFSLVDCCLFAQLVDLRDQLLLSGNSVVDGTFPASYEQIWNDMRRCVDRFLPMLTGFRQAGKKVFLLTNSLWDYTHVVMNFLEGRRAGNNKTLEWLDYFDVVVVAGNKPAFLVDEGSLPLFRVDPTSADCELFNIENDLPPTPSAMTSFLQQGKVFQGGNAKLLHRLLDLSSGDRLLYVGDHMFADILRSKRTLGWRTCLVVPELNAEITSHRKVREQLRELGQLLRKQSVVESRMGFRPSTSRQSTSASVKSDSHDVTDIDIDVDIDMNSDSLAFSADVSAALELADLTRRVRVLQEKVDQVCHPRWGALFRARNQQSRFGKQVTDYACLYTSRASNLGLVSPFRPFRPNKGKLPHDDFLDALEVSRSIDSYVNENDVDFFQDDA